MKLPFDVIVNHPAPSAISWQEVACLAILMAFSAFGIWLISRRK